MVEDGPVTVTVIGRGTIVIESTLDLALAPLASVTVALTLYVPLTLYVVVKLVPVPVEGDPPTADQLNV
jgi:hypothetical protein